MRRPAALIKRAVVRWQTGNSPSRRDRFSENGDTLVEVLLAIVVLGIAGLALLTAFATSITASSEHRNLASLDSSTRLAANVAIADVQQQSVAQASSATNNPFRCTTSTWPGPNFSNVTGFTVTATVGYWNGTSFVATCPKDYVPQQYALTITPTSGSNHYSTSVTTVVYDPSAPPPPNGVGTPTQLVWLQTPTTGTVGTAVTPEPEVAVEDALNNIVDSDLSSVTLKVVTGPGHFSSTCSGVESYGIVQFSNCILSAPGTYTIQVVDSSPGVAPTSIATLVVTAASVAKLAFTTAAVTGTASATANAGPITVQEQDPFGNPTFSPETVNLSSSSATGVFSLSSGGPAVTSVTIPGGATSTVSFFYGDTAAGSPTITASAPVAANLAPISQTETIKAGPAATFKLSTPTPTAGTAFNETVTAFDAFGNTATSFTGTQCITFSGPGNSPAPTNKAPTYPARGTCANGTSSVAFVNGVGTPSITLFKAGATTLTATQGTITGSASFSVTSGAFATMSLANPGTQKAGTQFNVTITGSDAFSNPATGTLSPTFSGPATSPNGTAPIYPTSVTFANGTATAPVTLFDAQTATLKVTSGAVNASTTFTVTAGPFAGFTMSTPTPTAGTAFTETLTAGDAYGNGGTGFTGSQCIAFSGPANSPNGNAPVYPAAGVNCTTGSSVTFNAGGVGTASITLFNSGATTLTATSVSNQAITGSANFTVASAGAKVFTIPTAPPTQTAGTAFGLGVGATDTYGNPFGGTVGTANGLSFTGPANSPAPSNKAPAYPASLSFTNGTATASITLYDAQSTTLTVGATGVTPATTPITVVAGGASKFTLSTPTPTAGTPFNETLTAVDGFSNTATGFTGAQCVTFSGPDNSPNGTAPIYPAAGGCAAGSALNFLNGVGTATITLTDAETTAIKAADGLVVGLSASFTVSAGPATTLTATSGANQTATTGSAFTNRLVATATDSSGNPVSGVAVTFAAPTNGASATFAACTSNPQTTSCTQNTGASGQATSSTFTANGTNGTYIVTASATGLASATFAEANKSNQTITFTSTAPGNATVGGATYTAVATASSGLAVTFTSGSTTVCTSGGTNGSVFTFVGSGTCVVNANQAGSTTFNAAPQVQQTFGVKRSQTISFTSTAPAAATVGGANYTPAATATSGLAVTITVDGSSSAICSITGGAVSFQSAGSCVLDANQAGNGTFNAAPQVQQTFAVGKGNQTITFTSTAPAAASVGGATYTAAATASSGLVVTFSSGSATVCTSGGANGSVFTFVGNGTCVVNANQAGNGNWNAATQVQQTFGVKHSQTVSFSSTAPGSATVGGATYTPAATATSALPAIITVDGSSTGICSISAGVVSFQTPGSCVLDANQAGNAGFYAAPQVQQTFTVAKGNQTITFTSTAPGAATVGGATYTAAATASSGLTVTFTSGSTAVCTSGGTNGSVFTFVGSGTCVVNANQAGTGNWNAATQVQQTFTVSKSNQTISFTSTAPAAATVGGATYTPAATATSGLTVTITVDASSSAICSIASGAVSFQTPGSCVLDANQAGNGTFNAAPPVKQTFTVGKGNQTITFTSSAPAAATVGGATYTAAATASSGLTVTFTSGSTTVCTSGGTNGSVFTFVGNGNCVVNANQSGNGNWNAAPQVQQTFGVKHSQTISFTSNAPTAASAGGATYTPVATSTSGLAVTISVDGSSTGCSIAGGVVSFQAAGSCVLDANQPGNTGFYAAPQVQQSFAVMGLTISSAQPSGGNANGPKMTLSGVGATGANRVSVTICDVATFPCSNRNTETTVTTGTTPANPWTTAATGNNILSYSTTYFAQATQGTQTSPVFTFATPSQTAPTAVALANGTGNTRTIDTNDTATITFSGDVNAPSLCSTWTNTGNQTLANATITFASAVNNDTFTATSGTCTTNFGTVFTGANYVSGTVTFTNSTITWNPTTDVLTFKLGTIGTGSGNRNTVNAGKPGYTASANATDTSGLPLDTTNFTSGTTSGF